MDRLKGKVALISGGARGQGAAEARLFVSEGAKVVIRDMLDDQCRKTAARHQRQRSARNLSFRFISTSPAPPTGAPPSRGASATVVSTSLSITQALLPSGGIEETTEEEWDSVVNINQKGVWLGMKYAVPAMRQRGAGSIINISSIYGLIGSGRHRRLSWHQGRRSPPD